MIAEAQSCPRCGDLSAPGAAPSFACARCGLPHVVADKYLLLRALAEGGFGALYLARHLALGPGALRAIKVIKPEILALPGARERFQQEIRLTAALSQENPHVVRIYDDFGEAEGLGHFYVMEYLEGESVRQLLAGGPPPLP